MKKLNFKPAYWCLTLLLLTGTQSCKKGEDTKLLQQSIDLVHSSTISPLATPSGLYVGTAYKTPTIPFMQSLASAPSGTMYVASSNIIYKIKKDSSVTILAQNLKMPMGIKVSKDGNVYAALFLENKIIKITPSGVVDTLKLNLTLNHPSGVAVGDDLTLYIADSYHHRIIKVSPAGVATVLAGKLGSTGNYIDGTGSNARFNNITNIKLGADGNLWVLDSDSKDQFDTGLLLRKITTQGVVTTVLDQTHKTHIIDIQPAKVDTNFNPTSFGNVFVLYWGDKITQYNTQNNTEIPITKNTILGQYRDGPIETALLQNSFALSFHENSLFVTNGTAFAIRKIYKK